MTSINRLSQTTDAVLAKVEEAQSALRRGFDGRRFNGWGIFSDPSMARTYIDQAMTELRAAQELMKSVDWPRSDADYDALDRAHNTGRHQ